MMIHCQASTELHDARAAGTPGGAQAGPGGPRASRALAKFEKNNGGQIKQKKINAKNVICGIFRNSNWGWESRTDKAESAAGLSFKKKN
jgi:hypothetical protein